MAHPATLAAEGMLAAEMAEAAAAEMAAEDAVAAEMAGDGLGAGGWRAEHGEAGDGFGAGGRRGKDTGVMGGGLSLSQARPSALHAASSAALAGGRTDGRGT